VEQKYLAVIMSTLPNILGILLIEKKNIPLNWVLYLISGKYYSFLGNLLALFMSTLPTQSS